MQTVLRLLACLAIVLVVSGWVLAAEEEASSSPAVKKEKQASLPELRDLFVNGELTVDVMVEEVSDRHRELTERLQKAIAADQKWWMEHVRASKSGEPLEYHPKLGLTQEEYTEFLKLAGTIGLKKGAETNIKVTIEEPGVVVFDGLKNLTVLTGVELDLNKGKVHTPFGDIDNGDAVDVEKSLLGAWKGTSWRHNKGDPETGGTSLRFALGQLANGRGVIVYDATKMVVNAGEIDREKSFRFSYILEFDPPKKQKSTTK